MDERFRCQCAAWDEPCSGQMTQEDLRCDPCRDGCGLMRFGEGAWMHARITDLKWSLNV